MSDLRVLVFGEDSNDCAVVAEIARRLLGASASVTPIARPIILAPSAADAKRRKNVDQLATAVKLASLKGTVDAVLIHRDADNLEPAHVKLAERIEADYSRGTDLRVIAAVPAWEIESWLLLFPEAIARRRRCWPAVKYGGHLGALRDSKEYLKRATRKSGKRCPEYRESDGPEIAQHIEFIDADLRSLTARSNSFSRFAHSVRTLLDKVN